MPLNSSKIPSAVGVATRTAVRVAATVLVAIIVRVVLDRFSDGRWSFSWRGAVGLTIVGATYFCIHLVQSFHSFDSAATAEAILAAAPPGSSTKTDYLGFVAMEYYALILNRTFVIFVAPAALYGWEALGIVTNVEPMYFQMYERMINERALMHNLEGFQKLAELKGGFVIPRSEILGVELIRRKKWGMGGIPHTGRIHIRLASGITREFILLGNVDAERILQGVITGASVSIS